MINGQVFMKKLMLMSVGVLLMTVLVTTAKADEHVTRTHFFDLDGIEDIEFSNGVGRFEIIQTNDDEMRVMLDIESEKKGFFRRSADVSDMDIEVKERGDRLYLSFEEKNAKAEWIVEIPKSANVERTAIQMGVGEVEVEIGETELEIELGVGEVFVEAPESSVGRVDINVGVGDANLRGGNILDRDSVFISKSINGEGSGNFSLEVDLGVGDVDVRLK